MKYLDYPEQQKHRGQDFPYFFYHVTWIHPRYNMPYHWHPLWEIVHVFSGHFHLHLDHDDLLLSPGDSAIISPGVIHGGTAQELQGCCYECLVLDTDNIFQPSITRIYEKKFLDILNQKLKVDHYYPASEKEINSLLVHMLDCSRYKPEGYTLNLHGLTYSLFGLILQKGYYSQQSYNKNQKKNQQFKQIMEYIDSHYQEDIRLADLAACVNMTPNYFCRYFKEITHRSPMDYLNYYRIEAACERLAYTDKTVSEIAYECGFQDASYFVKVFRHYKHVTPTQYINSSF